jgi:hypothetical protein
MEAALKAEADAKQAESAAKEKKAAQELKVAKSAFLSCVFVWLRLVTLRAPASCRMPCRFAACSKLEVLMPWVAVWCPDADGDRLLLPPLRSQGDQVQTRRAAQACAPRGP